MTVPPMNDDSAPVTHGQLKGSLDALRSELREDMQKMHDDLSRELARHVTASAEADPKAHRRARRPLPRPAGRVTALERELDEHRRDTALHPRAATLGGHSTSTAGRRGSQPG
jgi:hypothetical protein